MSDFLEEKNGKQSKDNIKRCLRDDAVWNGLAVGRKKERTNTGHSILCAIENRRKPN